MSFKRLLYLIGQLPRIIYLFREIWSVLVDSKEERLIEYLNDLQKITEALKNAKNAEEKQDVAMRISGLLSKL